jgi:hypothetical protein
MVRFTVSTIVYMLVAVIFTLMHLSAAQPKLQQTWLRQEGTRPNLPSLDQVKVAVGAKTPSR